ncbi:MAG: c-type cytochrome [bacterium]|nr:c-type cytochrome [bacterium]
MLRIAAVIAIATTISMTPLSAQESAPAPGYGPLQFAAPVPGSYTLPPMGDAADGAVLDERGRSRRLHELYDTRIVLLSFVYASCADANACPLATAVMHGVKTRLERDPELVERVRLLTLSFDTKRDTPEVMREYGASVLEGRIEWKFLTTASQTELAPILENYDQEIRRERDVGGDSTDQISHVLRVFLIDGNRRIRNIYSSSYLHAELLLSDIHTLLLEEERGLRRSGELVSDPAPATPRSLDLMSYAERPPLGLPPLPVPEDSPLTRSRIALGRKLFFDRRLSLNGTISCAMCHIPEQGFTNRELATAAGIEGRTVRRNAPTILNVAYVERLFHDGRESRLEQQAWGPLLASNEMGNPSIGSVIEKLEALPDYSGLFQAAFAGRGPGMETLGMALASYQRTLLAANSRFDRWYFGGDESALDEPAERGFRLFSGKAGCVACHPIGQARSVEIGALFTDHQMHNTGIGYRHSMALRPNGQRVALTPGVFVEVGQDLLASVSETPPGDLGRYEITLDPRDRWSYRTPSLRNVALTPPYMHDGSLATLREVIDYYNRGGVQNEALDARIRPLGLSSREVEDLVAFLSSLTGNSVEKLVLDAHLAPIGDPK